MPNAENDARIRAHAERIANTHLRDAKFFIVYEDEDCEELPHDEWRAIYDLITQSRVVLPGVIPPVGAGSVAGGERSEEGEVMSEHSAERDAAIAAVAGAHAFHSTSASRNGLNTHHAGCTCDPGLRFDWHEREAQHRVHVLAAVFAAGQASVIPPGETHA